MLQTRASLLHQPHPRTSIYIDPPLARLRGPEWTRQGHNHTGQSRREGEHAHRHAPTHVTRGQHGTQAQPHFQGRSPPFFAATRLQQQQQHGQEQQPQPCGR